MIQSVEAETSPEPSNLIAWKSCLKKTRQIRYINISKPLHDITVHHTWLYFDFYYKNEGVKYESLSNFLVSNVELTFFMSLFLKFNASSFQLKLNASITSFFKFNTSKFWCLLWPRRPCRLLTT